MAAHFNRHSSREFSSVISIKNFKEEILATIEGEDIERKRTGVNRINLANEMQITEDTLAELDEVCRLVCARKRLFSRCNFCFKFTQYQCEK